MIYGATARVLLPVAIVALVGAGVWGYQEHNEKNSVLIKAENQYQRAFHDLNYHLDKLQDELGKSLVVNTRKQMTPSLTNVWRLAYAAQNDVGQLPLTLMSFSKTEEFLARVADFSYGVAVRDLNKQPLTEKEYKTLEGLYKHSKEIQGELNKVQTKVIDNQLRWMDVESALASDDKKSDNTIVDGFQTIEKRVNEYQDLDWGVAINSLDHKKKQRVKGISGKLVTPEEAGRIALDFIGMHGKNVKVDVENNGKSEEYSAYSVRVTSRELKSPINVEVTKRAGKVVWLLNERTIGKPAISLAAAEESGKKFLHAHDYPNMEAVESDLYDGLGVFTFVPKQDNVLIYPDAVTVKVALDTGDVNGFHATEYLFNHKQRILPKAKVTAEKARTMLNPKVRVTDQRMALIEGKADGKEVLCYEFTGRFEKDTYMIYINALTGDEEEVVKMDVHRGTGQPGAK
ncbi:germination protein YpeB [Brevibacillus fluminis]|uniref:Germination protein YpeB n=1 Tax=Brevibacillus fluminis TaxID=511487 RepID=A0A3M8D338_9BACL|nr:germination protein YpeB [Brevibacillus fluminis]RNB81605.1 germination protein YpeB [Brevibacillus fluminis]